jgi:hypothetical protein
MNPLASYKCAQRVLMALAAISGIFLAASCGSSSITRANSNGFSDSSLSSTYVISMSGLDVNVSANTESFFAITGAITADGKGNITGSVDINDGDLGGVFTAQSVAGSTYHITQDGRGTGKLVTPEATFGIDFVLTSTGHGLITRFDGSGTGSGTIDLQGTAAQTSLGSLAFSLSGADSSIQPFGSVGAFTLNSSGTITTGIQDFNDNGSSATSGLTGAALTGSLVLSSSTAGTAQLNSSYGNLLFDVWVIDATHLKLIETDALGLALAGDAFTQQTSFTAGQLVFTLAGVDLSADTVVTGGFATTDVNGTLSAGTEDFNNQGTTGTVQIFTGSCGAPAPFAGGRCQLSSTAFTNGVGGNLAFAAYPSSGGVLLLEDDSLGLLQGAAYTQTATSFAASDGYGLNLSGTNSNGPVDDIAQFNTTTTNVSGVLDENDLASALLNNVALSGTYGAPTSGRGSLTIPNINTATGTLNLEYYVVDASTVLLIEGDSGQAAVGSFQLQSSASGAATQSHMSIMHPVFRPHGAFQKK